MKTGTTLLVLLLETATALTRLNAAAPLNDNFADRLPVIGLSNLATNCGATKEPGEPIHAGVSGGSSLWWSWIAPHSGGMRISSGPGVLIGVYTGNQVNQLDEVMSGRQSILFFARAGTAYAIALDTAAGECGKVGFAIYPESAPSNDRFADRLPLTGTKAAVTVADEAARSELGEPNHAGRAPYRSLWWSWTAPETGRFAASAEGYAFAARVAVYTGDQLENLSPVVAEASSAPQKPAEATFDAAAGTTYAIALDSIGEGATLLKLILSAVAENDNFANATDLGSGAAIAGGSTFGATREPGELATGIASVWYRWTAPLTRGYVLEVRMPAAFSFPPSTPDPWRDGPTHAGIRFPVAGVYRGDAPTNLIQVATATSAQGTDASLSFTGTAGATYFVAVSEASGFMSDFTLSVQPGPVNDNFAAAASIVPAQRIRFTTLGATREAGEPQHAGQKGGASLWWKWTAPSNGTFAFDASPEQAQAVAVVYTGNTLSGLTPVGAIAPTNFIHPITIHALAGTTYWLAVDQLDGLPSAGTVSLVAAPANDDFDHRSTLLTSRIALGSTYGATHEPGEPDHGNGTNSASVWWTWTAPSNGLYGVNGARFAHIYRGETLTNLESVTTNIIPLLLTGPRLEFEAVAAAAYQIVFDSAAGHGSGSAISVYPVPPNDHFMNRIALEGVSNVVHAAAANATREQGESWPIFLSSSVWWSWTAPDSGVASVLLSNAAAEVRVFTNRIPGLPPGLTNLGVVYGPLNRTRGPDFVASSNVTYYIAADSTTLKEPTVDFTLRFRATPPLKGDWTPPALQLSTSLFNPWFRQTNTFLDAPDAAESGQGDTKASSSMWARITGPGLLSFWWKISSSETNRNLFFFQDFWHTDILSGPRDWSRHTTWIGPGTNTVSWMFYGQPSAGLPGATAWVDRVEFVPGQSGAAVLDLKPPDYWGSAGLRINGEVGRAYQIEVSTNLVDWNLWTNVIRTDSYPYPLLSVATNQPAGFFRATTR